MKKLAISLLAVLLMTPALCRAQNRVIVVMIDGLRWQEVFRGADSALVNNKEFGNVDMMKADFWRATGDERRKALMPFTWEHIAKSGVMIGNRDKGCNMSVANGMWFSYPGYSETLCGYADDANINSNDPVDNPNKTVFEIANNWGDTRLNASFESLLASLKHPYLEYVFDKNSNIVVNSSDPNDIMQANTRIMGLRAGIRMIPGQAYKDNFRIAYSSIKNNGEMAMAPLYLMKVSEVEFLRAEGALRGWNMGGSAQQFYEQGIRNAQVEHRLMSTYYPNAVDEYMSLEAPVAYKYVDQYDHSYDAESVTTIGVKWNEGDSQETKLEKIITQKYIAAFPYSYEAWNDMRRTGYPKQFEVLNVEDGDGSLVQGDIIRKIPLPGRDTSVGMSERAGENPLGSLPRSSL